MAGDRMRTTASPQSLPRVLGIADPKPPLRDAATLRDAAVTVAVDAAPVGTGYVQVLGEDLIRASVLIDGRNVGSVPNVFPISYGRHVIIVEKPDGTRLAPQTIEVRESHNRANPLRPRW